MKQYLGIILAASMLCSSLLPAYAWELLESEDCLSPALSLNTENFSISFNSKIMITGLAAEQNFPALVLRISQELNNRIMISNIEKFYNGALDQIVEGDGNRAWRNLNKAWDLCNELTMIFVKLQAKGIIFDQELNDYFKNIDDYMVKISDCFENISHGDIDIYKKAWKMQLVDPLTGDFLLKGIIQKEDFAKIISDDRIELIIKELTNMGLLEVKFGGERIVTSVLDNISEPEQLQISGDIKEKNKVLNILRDISQGIPHSFFDVHQKGLWHASAEVLILDSKGRILVEHRSDKNDRLITKNLAASGHLLYGETYSKAARRIIFNKLGISVNPRHIYEVENIPYGQKKMGRSDFKGTIYYDFSLVMHVSSKDPINNEYTKSFIYVLDDQELIDIENKQIDGNLMVGFMPIHSIFDRKDKFDEFIYRSSFMRIFNNSDNFEYIIEQIHGILINILREASNNPEANQYDVRFINKFAEKIISLRNNFSDKQDILKGADDHELNRGKARALQELYYVGATAKILYRWQKLKKLLLIMEKENFINLSEIRTFFSELKILGLQEEDRASRALIYLLLRKDVKLVWDNENKYFVFKYGDRELQDIRIELDGRFRITNEQLIKDVKQIQRGVIASDMDLVLAMRDENVDDEVLKFFNQMRMIGFALAVISGNEFRKQYRRSLAELIHENLKRGFFIYANGAGLKVIWDSRAIDSTDFTGEVMGAFVGDKQYGCVFSQEQESFFNTKIQSVLKVWETVIETIRTNRQLLGDINMHNDLCSSIKGQLEKYDDSPECEIAEIITQNLSGVINDFYAVLRMENEDHKFKAYLGKLKAQLNPLISKQQLQKEKNWPYLDKRPSMDGKNLIQVTLKPIYPANKYLSTNQPSSREILGGIVSELTMTLNAEFFPDNVVLEEYAPLAIKQGGSSSVDIMRADVDKAKAAKDLIVSMNLQDAPDLLLAMDDEMDFTGVGFPFLKVPGITVLSMEKTKNEKKRKYSVAEKAEIKAFSLWSQECGIGSEIEATKNVFQMLLDVCESEIWELLKGKNKSPIPAIRKVKEMLYKKSKAGAVLSASPVMQVSPGSQFAIEKALIESAV